MEVRDSFLKFQLFKSWRRPSQPTQMILFTFTLIIIFFVVCVCGVVCVSGGVVCLVSVCGFCVCGCCVFPQ